jgi:hypothetical protein
MRGSIDGVAYQIGKGWVVSGWALDTANPNRPLDIEILNQDRVVAAGRAAEFREDLREAGIGGGICAFALPLQQAEIPHGVTARQLFLKVGGSDTLIASVAVCLQPLIGDLDAVAGLFIDGWACDTSNLGASVVVELLVDGQTIERAAADRFRHDLAEYGLGSGCYGFKFIVPRPFADGHPHRFSARIANTTLTLGKETEVIVRPQQLTPGLRRLYYLRETAHQHMFGIDQALLEEGQQLGPATAIPSSDFRADSVRATREFATTAALAVIAPKVGPDDLV